MAVRFIDRMILPVVLTVPALTAFLLSAAPVVYGAQVCLAERVRAAAVYDMPASAADTIPEADTVYALDELMVVASRTSGEVVPVQTLSGEKLRNLGTHSIADAIRYFSGVQIKDFGGIGGLKSINVRSLGSQHVGVFYDGVELGNAQNGIVDLGRFSLDNLESVSLYNGQKSAALQSAKDYASANAVYLQTRKPRFTGGKRNNWNLGLKGGSFMTVNPSVLWEHKISDRLSLSASTEFLYTTGRYKFTYAKQDGYDTTGIRQNGDVRMTRAEVALFGDIEGGYWRAKVYFYDSERGYPGAVVRGKFVHQDRQRDDNFFAQGSFKKDFAPWYSLQVSGKYAYDYLHYLADPRLDVTAMYVDNRYRQQEAYLSAAHRFKPFRWWTLSLATDFQWNSLDADLRDFVYPLRYAGYGAAATAFEFGGLKLSASLLYTYVHDVLRASDAEMDDRHQLSPAVIASWKPLRDIDLELRAFYKKNYRMPTFNDLYYTFTGASWLEPEETTQYDFGATWHLIRSRGWFRGTDIQADVYFNQIDNKIIAMPTSNQFRWTMMNLGYVEILGTDIAAQGYFRFGPVDVSPRVSYTFQRARDLSDPTSEWYGGQVAYIPLHSCSVTLGAAYSSWSLNYSFIYTGGRYESSANIPENYAQPWYTHDVSLTKSFEFHGWGLRATVLVNNILNQQYEVVKCYPMPGTNFMIKVNFII